MGRITTSLWGKIPTVGNPPPDGWLTISQFAERASMKTSSAVQQIYKAIESGKIDRKHLAMMLGGTQRTVVIDWDSAAYNFIAARRRGSRPDDFVENAAHEYKPFKRTAQQEIAAREEQEMVSAVIAEVKGEAQTELTEEQQRIVNQRLVTLQTVVPVPDDVTTAKYVKELLEIEKRQVELRKEANQLIEIDTERSILASLAAQLNGNANKAIPKWSTIFAAEEDPRVIRQLMKQMFVDVFRPMDGDEK